MDPSEWAHAIRNWGGVVERRSSTGGGGGAGGDVTGNGMHRPAWSVARSFAAPRSGLLCPTATFMRAANSPGHHVHSYLPRPCTVSPSPRQSCLLHANSASLHRSPQSFRPSRAPSPAYHHRYPRSTLRASARAAA
ncbi:hypothetical protein HYPSUDRAFT_205335 [Hypholoma sublateritium FD-334 SS-4]|uniref:Uncharacterized protein n=1 Tax=Hypholoma sublateritium (strain FD-334 SS-4) TaxID=945553 RepID=A0A0D2KUZ3_HYPSF|nr:hypothetical protein HYPSUDRAFT_205335 [Hypholoma sublateritium FD-334 SS-4]